MKHDERCEALRWKGVPSMLDCECGSRAYAQDPLEVDDLVPGSPTRTRTWNIQINNLTL